MTMPNVPDFSDFSDVQMMTLLNVPGAMRIFATNELARRHQLPQRSDTEVAADRAAMALQGVALPEPAKQTEAPPAAEPAAPAES